MRNRHIVAYDIAEDSRRTRVFKILDGYGDHLQYSVFRCDLSPRERVLLVQAIENAINHKEDQVLVIDLGPAEWRADDRVTTLGNALDLDQRRVVVV